MDAAASSIISAESSPEPDQTFNDQRSEEQVHMKKQNADGLHL